MAMTSPMTERVARAMCIADGDDPDGLIITSRTGLANPPVPKWVAISHQAEAAIKAMPSWQPIETAPKDGSLIDLYGINHMGEGERLPHCRWSGDPGDPDPETDRWYQCYAEIGAGSSAGFSVDDRFIPKHWMPLPAPPAPDTKDGA